MPQTDIQETKAFYKTSEFWLHAVGQLLLWIGALPTGGAPSWVKTVVSLALVASYGISRGVAKSGSPKAVTQGPVIATAGVKAASFTPPTTADEQDAQTALADPPQSGAAS